MATVAKTDPDLLLWPRLTRFYGISPSEIARTPRVILELYAEQIPRLQAQEQLMAVQAACMPHATEQAARRVHKMLARMAETTEDAVDPRRADHVQGLASIGIKVVTS